MRAPRELTKLLVAAGVVLFFVLLPAVVLAQEPSPLGPLPGQAPDRAPTPIWLTLMAVAVAVGALGLVILIAASYAFLSRRFFAKEEAPPPRRPSVRIAPGVGAPPPARSVGHPVSELPGPAAPAAGRTATATAERPAQAPAAEQPAREPPAEEPPAQEQQAAEAKPQPARHSGPAELDQETYDRVLKEQIDKGASQKVAEGRARAAAVKAAREKAGAG